MKIKKSKSIILLIVVLLLPAFLQAQESINTAGADATGNDGTVAYSIGQVVYTTNEASTGTVAQGVQQAYEIFTVGVKETALDIALSVFPNPTADHLILDIKKINSEQLSYQLYDMQGKLLKNAQIETQQTQINMNDLATATYFLNVLNQENKKIESFKIVKIQ